MTHVTWTIERFRHGVFHPVREDGMSKMVNRAIRFDGGGADIVKTLFLYDSNFATLKPLTQENKVNAPSSPF